ncbi:hypothetical protein N7492_005276 [Penicillium capsulatum]|uniref:Uncharacterized protein n=1 Tax=Penicillium capsulatum TaxID=69766 RepID=A0A9W9IBN0_9EURO|nr:hypothetical protein N7492_005276 [Penicillium capsulatum]
MGVRAANAVVITLRSQGIMHSSTTQEKTVAQMPVQKTSSLKTYFDELEETNGDEECKAWLSRAFDSRAELAAFVAERREGGDPGEYVGFLKGSFNFSFHFSFGDGRPDAIIRFSKPGHTATAYRDEKVANEVQIMGYLRQTPISPFLVFTAGASFPRVHNNLVHLSSWIMSIVHFYRLS